MRTAASFVSSQICPIIDNCRPFSQLVFSSSVFFYVWNIPDLLSHNFAPCPCPPPCTWWHTVLTLTIMTDFPSAFCTMASLACWTASLTMVILISIRRSAVETVSRATDHHFRNSGSNGIKSGGQQVIMLKNQKKNPRTRLRGFSFQCATLHARASNLLPKCLFKTKPSSIISVLLELRMI